MPPPLPHRQWWQHLQSVLVPLILVVAGGIISWMQIGGWVVVGALVMAASLMWWQGRTQPHAITMILAFVTTIAALDYLLWRLMVTNWANWWIAVPLVLAEAFGVVHTVGLQVTIWPWHSPALHPTEDPTLRPIFVFIPTVNEGSEILTPTIRATLAAREHYLEVNPQGRVTIVICNDGRVANSPDWQGVEALAQRMGVLCVTRTVGGGAKAGNIENARKLVGATGDALLVIFDADQVAKPEFFLKLIAPFADPTVGWVQSGQYYGNKENPVARWAHDQQALFYRVLCGGKAAQNAAFICGTNVMLRAAALDQIGGLPQDSVTEDFAASIRLHTRWRS
ncbi:MAG: glycosyltransferase, partial [Ktedonobacterales bacterium]|nr:glycosyltransferase [Ktedonobacterales bacterium]